MIHAPRGDRPARLHVEGSDRHGELYFVGRVEGRLRELLVETLRALATGEVDWDTPATPQLLDTLARNVALGVHVSATCPFCPSVARAALHLALGSPRVSVTIVRADLHPSPRVRSVPTVLLDGVLVATGQLAEHELAERVVARAASPAPALPPAG